MPTVIVRMKEADALLFGNPSALKEHSFRAISYMDDRFYMQRAIRLARKGTGRVSPNPRVGAVIVKNGTILAEGFHAVYGGAHAEINALSKLKSDHARGSTLYINLEPCCHYGKTPPCSDALVRSGIRRVIIGMKDPNPLVAGGGIRKLKRSGIDVRTGILEQECFRLNEPFFKYVTQKKPFVTLKIAQTLDGKIATRSGQSKWITSEVSRKKVLQLRRESDAVLVGIQTVLVDNPLLTLRSVKGVQPKRIVLDSRLRIPLDSNLMRSNEPPKTIVATVEDAPADKIHAVRKTGAEVWIIKKNQEGRIDLNSLLKKAAETGITSILVEGGREVFTSFLKSGLADAIVVFTAPKVFGKGMDPFGDLGILEPADALQFRTVKWSRIGEDMMFEGRMNKST